MNEYGPCNDINTIECIIYTGDRLKNKEEYSIYCKSTIYFVDTTYIYLIFNTTYIITLLHLSTLVSHLQA
jgi:hypothetical protein